jgi:hypothetical protein
MNLAAALLAVLLALSPQDGGTAPRDGGTASDGGSEGQADGGVDGGSAGAEKGGESADGGADPDAEIVRHLDELEALELLQHLELFDTRAEPDRKP